VYVRRRGGTAYGFISDEQRTEKPYLRAEVTQLGLYLPLSLHGFSVLLKIDLENKQCFSNV
jgi:hypothetical protein